MHYLTANAAVKRKARRKADCAFLGNLERKHSATKAHWSWYFTL